MFSDALSTSLIQLCDKEKLSYEAAAERVGCSPEFLGRIIRRKSSPTISFFEKICHGFARTPNQLLGMPGSTDELLYRVPMSVSEIRIVPAAQSAFSVCPRCKCSLEREYQAYCSVCGQCLSWNRLHKAKRTIILPPQSCAKESGPFSADLSKSR